MDRKRSGREAKRQKAGTKRRKVAARGDEETRLAKHLSNINAQQHQPAPLPPLVVVGAPQEVLAGFGKFYCDLGDGDPKMWRLEACWADGNRTKWTIEWYEDMAECAFVLLSRSPQRTKLVQFDGGFVHVFCRRLLQFKTEVERQVRERKSIRQLIESAMFSAKKEIKARLNGGPRSTNKGNEKAVTFRVVELAVFEWLHCRVASRVAFGMAPRAALPKPLPAWEDPLVKRTAPRLVYMFRTCLSLDPVFALEDLMVAKRPPKFRCALPKGYIESATSARPVARGEIPGRRWNVVPAAARAVGHEGLLEGTSGVIVAERLESNSMC